MSIHWLRVWGCIWTCGSVFYLVTFVCVVVSLSPVFRSLLFLFFRGSRRKAPFLFFEPLRFLRLFLSPAVRTRPSKEAQLKSWYCSFPFLRRTATITTTTHKKLERKKNAVLLSARVYRRKCCETCIRTSRLLLLRNIECNLAS